MSGKRLLTVLTLVALASGFALAAEGDRPDRRPPGPRRLERREGRQGLPGRGDRPDRSFWVSEEQEAELLEALKEHRPERYEQLMRVRREAPRLYRLTLGRLWRWYQSWREMSDRAREAAFRLEEARIKIFHLMRDVRAAEPGEPRRQAIERLREALHQQFEAEQSLREERLAQLEEEIQRIRGELKKRVERRKEIIDERLDNLMASPPHRPGRAEEAEDFDRERRGRERDAEE